MRLPNTAHTSRSLADPRVHRRFRLEDVWALPTPGWAGAHGPMTAVTLLLGATVVDVDEGSVSVRSSDHHAVEGIPARTAIALLVVLARAS